jgi:hypothetical protein
LIRESLPELLLKSLPTKRTSSLLESEQLLPLEDKSSPAVDSWQTGSQSGEYTLTLLLADIVFLWGDCWNTGGPLEQGEGIPAFPLLFLWEQGVPAPGPWRDAGVVVVLASLMQSLLALATTLAASLGRGDELLLPLWLLCLCFSATRGDDKFLVFCCFGFCLFCDSVDLELSLSDGLSASTERIQTGWSMNWSALEFGEKSKVVVEYGGTAVGAMAGGRRCNGESWYRNGPALSGGLCRREVEEGGERHGGEGRSGLEANVFPWAMLSDKRSSFMV